MTAVQELQHLLFEELELIVRTTTNLMAKVKPEMWSSARSPTCGPCGSWLNIWPPSPKWIC